MDFVNVIKNENLMMPDYDKENFLDLIRLIYNYCGMNYSETEGMKKIKKHVLNKKHLVLILVDGLGSNLLDKISENLLYENKIMDLQAIFPTATGCVLNSLATGEFPSKTGIYGWFGYNRDLKLNYYTLLTKELETGRELTNDELIKIFACESVFNKLNRKTSFIQPNAFVNSKSSCYFANDDKRYGYNNYDEAIKKIEKDIKSDLETISYLYIPNVDSLEHRNGPYSDIVYKEISIIEENIKKLLPLDNDTEIIITADHGQLGINEYAFMDLNKYKKYFYALPSIDMGTCTFFVKEDMKNEFINEFNIDFKDKLFLFDREEFIKRNLFGKDMTSFAKSCLGEYIGICKRHIMFYSAYEQINEIILGNHTGLSKEEIMIPLIVIK